MGIAVWFAVRFVARTYDAHIESSSKLTLQHFQARSEWGDQEFKVRLPTSLPMPSLRFCESVMRFLPLLLTTVSHCVLSLHTMADERSSVDRNMVKVAAVQISGYDKGDLPREGYDPTADALPYIRRAVEDSAQLVVFPEYVLGHISVPGEETQRIATAAKNGNIYVVIGCWEKLEGDSFANTALLFGRDGAIIGKYRKTHAAVDHFEGDVPWQRPPQGKSREWMKQNDPEWIMESGQDLPVFKLDFGTIGIMTCDDGWFPEPARVLSLRGAELILWINGRGGTVEDFIVRTTMFQSHVAMVTTNQAYGGGTMIAGSPRGSLVARAPDKQESYISGTINLQHVRRARASSRNFAQRRPDLYSDLTAPRSPSAKAGAPQVRRANRSAQD